MLTTDEIMNAREFHLDGCVHPKGYCYTFRRNGATKTWKTRPGQYRIPYKYGMYEYGYIHHGIPAHTAENCPLKKGASM